MAGSRKQSRAERPKRGLGLEAGGRKGDEVKGQAGGKEAARKACFTGLADVSLYRRVACTFFGSLATTRS